MLNLTKLQKLIIKKGIDFMKQSGTPDADSVKAFTDKSHAECIYRIAGNYHTDNGPHYKDILTDSEVLEIIELQNELDKVPYTS